MGVRPGHWAVAGRERKRAESAASSCASAHCILTLRSLGNLALLAWDIPRYGPEAHAPLLPRATSHYRRSGLGVGAKKDWLEAVCRHLPLLMISLRLMWIIVSRISVSAAHAGRCMLAVMLALTAGDVSAKEKAKSSARSYEFKPIIGVGGS